MNRRSVLCSRNKPIELNALVMNSLDTVQQERNRRITAAQDQKRWISELKSFLKGNLDGMSLAQCKRLAKIAMKRKST